MFLIVKIFPSLTINRESDRKSQEIAELEAQLDSLKASVWHLLLLLILLISNCLSQ